MTVNLLPGQDVLTVSNMQTKIDAQLRSLGCGFVPESMARDHIAAGRLVVKRVLRERPEARLGYAWRTPVAGSRGGGAQAADGAGPALVARSAREPGHAQRLARAPWQPRRRTRGIGQGREEAGLIAAPAAATPSR